MDFLKIPRLDDDNAINPFAGKKGEEWIEGAISIEFLKNNFGQYTTAQEVIEATQSEGLRLYFIWLHDQGLLN